MIEPLRQLEGKYEILHKLQEGGMGAIYKVRHLLLDEIRVVKVMRPHAAADSEMRRRFVQEAKIAIRVRHPNIAQLYDFAVDEQGTAFIVMEFIDGVTLQEVIASGDPPSLNLALEIALQGLQSLSCIHRNQIVHRDISSDNLMLAREFDGQPVVKLIDLGIARDDVGDTARTATGTFLGKARYSAPEQFEGSGAGTLGPVADVYSFGVMFYELLTGRLPVEGASFAELAGGHLFKPPVPFDRSDPQGRIPPAVRELVLRSIEKRPEARIPSADAFIERLQELRGTAPVDVVEVERLLRRARAAKPAPEPAAEGSSQERLNQHFAPETTNPAALGAAGSEPAPPGDAEERRRRQIALTVDELCSTPSGDIVAEIDAALLRHQAAVVAGSEPTQELPAGPSAEPDGTQDAAPTVETEADDGAGTFDEERERGREPRPRRARRRDRARPAPVPRQESVPGPAPRRALWSVVAVAVLAVAGLGGWYALSRDAPAPAPVQDRRGLPEGNHEEIDRKIDALDAWHRSVRDRDPVLAAELTEELTRLQVVLDLQNSLDVLAELRERLQSGEPPDEAAAKRAEMSFGYLQVSTTEFAGKDHPTTRRILREGLEEARQLQRLLDSYELQELIDQAR